MEDKRIIPVANCYGWTSTVPNPMTRRFVDLIKTLVHPTVIDIGAGYGVASIPAMEAGADVIVNDIQQEQLDHVADLARTHGFDRQCRLLNAALPDLPEVPPLDAVHASNVLHFLTGAQIVQAAAWMHEALRPGGRAFLQVQSPYCGHFHAFLPEYETRKAAGRKWPGEIDDAKRYAAPEILHMMVNFNHVLEAGIMAEIFEGAGFSIEYADYYTRPGLPEVSRFDGRENLGIVALRE